MRFAYDESGGLRALASRMLTAIDTVNPFGRLRRIERKLTILDRFSHGTRATYIGDNRLLCRLVVGHKNLIFYLEADDRLITPWLIGTGVYEEPVTDFFVRALRPDSRSIDVGANFGYFTCLMARFCPQGRVIGVEADRRLFELLSDNLVINGFTTIADPVHAAANADGAAMTLYRRISRSANTSMVRHGSDFTDMMGEPPVQPFEVAGMRVDDLAQRLDGRVDFLKIDVEGAEPLVFEGARATIAANPQLTIVMEWSPGQIHHAGFDLAGFVAGLTAQRLGLYDIDGKRLVPLSEAELLNLPYRAGVVFRRVG